MTIPQRASKTNANKLNKASIKEIETLVEVRALHGPDIIRISGKPERIRPDGGRFSIFFSTFRIIRKSE
jgi:hypothetical protein